ncbi:type III polyketide synthase [bacterium]|nr:MAG: type III polyketide synthase [bacterium]
MDTSRGKHIASVGTVVPERTIIQAEAIEVIEKHYKGKISNESMELARRIFGHPSVKTRHIAINDPAFLINEDLDARIKRFTENALQLSCDASLSAMKTAGLKPQDITGIVVNTCTGYVCPGISTYIIEKLGLRRDIPAYDLVGAGCGGAVPNLNMSRALLDDRLGSAVLSVSVEICTAAFHMDDDISLIVSNAIFGDGASACVLWNRPQGIELLDCALIHAPEHREKIRFIHKNGQLINQLSADLPRVVGKVAAELVSRLLKKNGLLVADVKHWALHAGGENVINAVKDELGLTEPQVRWARKVLSEYGNISSPSAIFALKQILGSGIATGDWGIIVAFGAGMSAYACLFRKI